MFSAIWMMEGNGMRQRAARWNSSRWMWLKNGPRAVASRRLANGRSSTQM